MKRKWPEKNEACSPKRMKQQPFCSLCEVPCPDENALQNHYQGLSSFSSLKFNLFGREEASSTSAKVTTGKGSATPGNTRSNSI